MSPLDAWLYLDRMDLSRYWPKDAPTGWDQFHTRFKQGNITLEECAFLSPSQRHAFEIALESETYLPRIPSITVPQPITPDLFPLNEPGENAIVLVSANNRLTFDLLATIWSHGLTPAYFLLLDCSGHTVDMAMIFKTFTPERLQASLQKSGLETRVKHRRMIAPGLTAPLAKDFEKATGWQIEIGPVCAAEMPLFLGDRWLVPDAH